MYPMNMFYAINLHNIIRQIYFNRRTNPMKKERAIQSSSFPKLHAEFSQEKCKREIYKGQESQIGNLQRPQAPTDSPPMSCIPFLWQTHVEFRSYLPKLWKNWTKGWEKRVKGQINVKPTGFSRVHPEIRTQPFPLLTFDIPAGLTAKSRSPNRELQGPESSKTDSASGSRL